MSESDVLLSEREGAVLTLTMNRPEVLNALDSQLVIALRRAIEDAGRDPHVRAIVLRGQGRAFSAGGDIKGMAARADAGNADLGEALRQVYSPLIRALRRCPPPVNAPNNWVAAGAGHGLAKACDLRHFAARDLAKSSAQ